MKIQSLLTTSLLLLPECSKAFSPQANMRTHISPRTTEHKAHAVESEDEAMFLMNKARTCAFSDTCSIDEAEEYLEEIIHIQSSCITGSLTSEQVCEDIDFPNEVIAALREKIQTSANTPTKALNLKSMMSPVFITMFTIYLSSSIITMNQNQPGADTFTAQEVWWAIRDGYAQTLFSQFFKNGGLAPMDVSSDNVVFPFTPVEWWWATRDGYLGDMISASLKTGGLEMSLTELGMDDPVTTPFLSEEVRFAVKDGYLSDMIHHYMKNGGL